jgi:protein phosphatase
VGQVRQNNEDTILTTTLTMPKGETALLLLVADGMGGAQAGEEASRLAAETIQQQLQQSLQQSAPTDANDWAQRLQTALQTANTRIYNQAQSHPDQRGMGTTCTLVVVVGQNGYLGHVGDSRAYLINTNGVTEDGAQWIQLTADHTLVARLVDIGHLSQAEAKLLPQRNMLYRALGAEATIEGDTGRQPLELGDILLLCSDGLTNFVHDHELSNLVMQATNLEVACEELVALANSRGGRDNISVVVARVESIKC